MNLRLKQRPDSKHVLYSKVDLIFGFWIRMELSVWKVLIIRICLVHNLCKTDYGLSKYFGLNPLTWEETRIESL